MKASFRTRLERLEGVASQREYTDVLVLLCGSPHPLGTLLVAGAIVPRIRNESDEAYRARAFSLVPGTGNGMRVVHESN